MEFLLQQWHWSLLALVSGGWWLVETLRAARDKSRVTPVQATLLINNDNAVPVDVRTDEEFAAGHICGAVHVPLEQVPEHKELQRLKHRPVIVYCESGARSAIAVKRLRQAGFEKVYHIVGGMAEWRKANLPVVSKREEKAKGKKHA